MLLLLPVDTPGRISFENKITPQQFFAVYTDKFSHFSSDLKVYKYLLFEPFLIDSTLLLSTKIQTGRHARVSFVNILIVYEMSTDNLH